MNTICPSFLALRLFLDAEGEFGGFSDGNDWFEDGFDRAFVVQGDDTGADRIRLAWIDDPELVILAGLGAGHFVEHDHALTAPAVPNDFHLAAAVFPDLALEAGDLKLDFGILLFQSFGLSRELGDPVVRLGLTLAKRFDFGVQRGLFFS